MNISTKKDTTKGKNINISSLKQDFKNRIHANIEVQCSKNYFKNLLEQEAGAFGNNMGKELQKPRPKFKNMFYTFTVNICSACNPMQVVVFCKH